MHKDNVITKVQATFIAKKAKPKTAIETFPDFLVIEKLLRNASISFNNTAGFQQLRVMYVS
ncbi:hypothetical protein [Salinimicrobium sp. GXAS 041]|uniref:hypothetical protein n=1 Tax=Salinimicrobium sp. GXAS 041 TaxID=3400806 RepID=UPI003C728518